MSHSQIGLVFLLWAVTYSIFSPLSGYLADRMVSISSKPFTGYIFGTKADDLFAFSVIFKIKIAHIIEVPFHRKQLIPGISLDMRSANERSRYNVTTSLIGWAHTKIDPCDTMTDNDMTTLGARAWADIVLIWFSMNSPASSLKG